MGLDRTVSVDFAMEQEATTAGGLNLCMREQCWRNILIFLAKVNHLLAHI